MVVTASKSMKMMKRQTRLSWEYSYNRKKNANALTVAPTGRKV